MGNRLLIFDTHPIQYRSPVFRSLYAKHPDLKVYFFDDRFDANRWWFNEVGKIPPQDFRLPMKDGFPNETVATARLGYRAAFARLREILEAERPSAVLTYGYYQQEHWMLRWLTARLEIPLLFIGETFESRGGLLRRSVRKPLRDFFFRKVSRFIAIGGKTASYYRSLGIDESRVDHGRYCADTAFFDLEPARAAMARRAFRLEVGIPDEAPVLLFVGRLFERKRPFDLLALHRLLESHGGVHTVVIGNGPMEDELAQAASGVPRFHLLGFRDPAALRSAYHGADLLVVPSEFETWGLVVNEAAAAGKPSLVTETCGVAGDLVVSGQTGFVYPTGRMEEAARCLKPILSDPSGFERMGKKARERVAREYSTEGFADVILSSLSKLTPPAV